MNPDTHDVNVNGPGPGVIPGRIVHYVLAPSDLPDGKSAGELRPAMLIRVWNPSDGCSNLQVFLDGTNDGQIQGPAHLWATSRNYDTEGALGTWHWPPRG